jgi:indole-3-glycerol phosphate synthase
MTFKEILEHTGAESVARQNRDTLKSLKKKARDMGPTRGFAAAIAARPFSIIAEVKTRSPSMGEIFPEKYAEVVHRTYNRHALVSAISVLTQQTDFGGSEERLRQVRRETQKPVLRKDFIWSEFEVYFSRCNGADAILLMTNVVKDPVQFAELHAIATDLGMDVLCEVHSPEDLAILPPTAKVCGINSRKFMSNKRFMFSALARQLDKDATIDLSAFGLFDSLPAKCLKIAESGVTVDNIKGVLDKFDFNAALIGTGILKSNDVQAGRELDKLAAQIAKRQVRAATQIGAGLGVSVHA